MEITPLIVALISGTLTLVGVLVGYIFKGVSGEQRANIRQITAQAKKGEAEADSTYAELARNAARETNLLREEYKKDRLEYVRDKREMAKTISDLRKRIDRLEKEILVMDSIIDELKEENRRLGGMVG